MTLSEIQSAIVRHEGGNVLVSAAAGSGKTTVMTERIIRIITDEKNKVSVSRILVVTFTNAAAAHMKEVIFSRLRERVQEEPDNAWLSEQLMNLPMARIMTIDAFCLRVIRDNIHQIENLDPGFRVCGETEMQLLKQDCLAQTLEDLYLEAEEKPEQLKDYLLFIDRYCGKKSDLKVEDLAERIFSFLLTLPNPLEWLDEKTEEYKNPIVTPFTEDAIRDIIRQYCESALEGFKTLRDTNELEAVFFAQVCEKFEQRLEWCEKAPLAELIANLKFTFPRRKTKIAEMYNSPEEAERVGKYIKNLKDDWEKVSNHLPAAYGKYVSDTDEDRLEREEQYLFLSGLRRILAALYKNYAAEKAERGLADFADFSHYALDILCQKDSDGLYIAPSVPTATAQLMAEDIDCIFIDEYQDSNAVQELILTSVAKRDENGNCINVFMVGDVKQSIYRFRQAEPELFMQKSRDYLKTGASDQYKDLKPRKFVLSDNRRSEKGVLDAANFVFGALMSGGSTEILYTDDERLHFPADKQEMPSEVRLTVLPSSLYDHMKLVEELKAGFEDLEGLDFGEELNESQLKGVGQEACYIAACVRKLLTEGKKITVREKNQTVTRDCKRNDIAILLPKVKGLGTLMKKALEEAGIPAVTDASLPFFQCPEIILVSRILSIIDNPRQDIPLVSVLHSPCFNFSADDLAKIRLADKAEGFYEALLYYRDNFRDALSVKITSFIDTLMRWREMNRHESVHDLLWQVFIETDYYLYVSSMPFGNIRKANLDKMLDLAVSFENSTYSGLYQFLRYLDTVKRYDSDEGEARIEADEDGVRIMTIHKSKGLEFPVVFLGGLGTRILAGKKTSVVWDRELGFGLTAGCIGSEPKNESNLIRFLVNAKNERLEKAERIRLLYVGMTRAISNLYMTGIGCLEDEFLGEGENSKTEFGAAYRLSEHQFLAADTYLEWFRYLFSNAAENGVACPFSVCKETSYSQGDPKEDSSSEASENQQYPDFCSSDFEWKYPYRKDLSLKARYSVSEIKKNTPFQNDEEKDEAKTVSLFSLDGHGAERGTVMHTFFANADWSSIGSYADIERETERLIAKEILTGEEADLLVPKALLTFRKSSLCERMLASGRVWKEQPFILRLPISELRSLTDAWPGELGEDVSDVMIQGIIDLFFEEEGGLVLADYKTDRTLGERELRMYGLQLEIYKRAMERILHLPVKEMYLYSTSKGESIQIE